MSGRLQGRVYAVPKYRSKVLTTQVVDSSGKPVRRSEEMEVDNPRVPDRGSEGMEVDNPRVPCRRSEDHDVRIEALGEVVQISPQKAGSPRSVKIAVRKNEARRLRSRQGSLAGRTFPLEIS